jgi:hypothetical protein
LRGPGKRTAPGERTGTQTQPRQQRSPPRARGSSLGFATSADRDVYHERLFEGLSSRRRRGDNGCEIPSERTVAGGNQQPRPIARMSDRRGGSGPSWNSTRFTEIRVLVRENASATGIRVPPVTQPSGTVTLTRAPAIVNFFARAFGPVAPCQPGSSLPRGPPVRFEIPCPGICPEVRNSEVISGELRRLKRPAATPKALQLPNLLVMKRFSVRVRRRALGTAIEATASPVPTALTGAWRPGCAHHRSLLACHPALVTAWARAMRSSPTRTGGRKQGAH